jgi:hypothetical protein
MKRLGWHALNRLFRLIDRVYCRVHRLQAVGPLLYIQPQTYRGPSRRLDDATVIAPGDRVAVLHFNNRNLQQAQQAAPRGQGGFVFARLLISALQTLAEQVREDPGLQPIAGFHGITWIPPHGRKIGFEARPLPPTWRTRVQAWYLGWLLYAFNPATARRLKGRLQPHAFWLSRQQLLTHFANGRRPR